MPQNKHKRDKENNATILPGWPGFRTRRSRSGLDPIDTSREAAFMEGRFVRKLFTGQLRTREPLKLILMSIIGIGLLWIHIPFLGDIDFFQLNGLNMRDSIIKTTCLLGILAPGLIFGIGLLINVLINIQIILGVVSPDKGVNPSKNKKDKKKKHPKRRKDYH